MSENLGGKGSGDRDFATTTVGLKWDSIPMKLYQLGKKLFWDPATIDLTEDIRHWAKLGELERLFLVSVWSKFVAGEEAVSLDINPLISVMIGERRTEEVMYLEQFAFEESKHVEAFSRVFETLRIKEDTSKYTKEMAPSYRKIFYEELPKAMWALKDYPSPENQVKASVTYNLIAEGVIAEGGYNIFRNTLGKLGVMPGFLRAVNWIAVDESRHIAYGVYLVSRLIAEYGDPVYRAALSQASLLSPYALRVFEERSTGPAGEIPFAGPVEATAEYARGLLKARLGVMDRARNLPLERVMGLSLRDLGVETSRA